MTTDGMTKERPMRALTIIQPYAELIASGVKKVENRTWSTDYRGPLLIHAGKSRKFLNHDNYGIPLESMTFGAIVGIAQLRDCVELNRYMSRRDQQFPAAAVRQWPWLLTHEHAEGPMCFVLQDCRRFKEPIPYKGAQGFFNVPNEVVADALASLTQKAGAVH